MKSPALTRALLTWYDANRRALPWRDSKDPYRIWISEIMLQQTRVVTVIERYQQFLRRFPSVKKLAAARESSVLAEWTGLGYYRRARNLHAAARIIAREKKFPEHRRIPACPPRNWPLHRRRHRQHRLQRTSSRRRWQRRTRPRPRPGCITLRN